MQQPLCHLWLLLMLKMSVVGGYSQTRMPDLIFHKITGHHVRCVVFKLIGHDMTFDATILRYGATGYWIRVERSRDHLR